MNTPGNIHRLDPVSLPYLAQAVEEAADPVAALRRYVAELRAALDAAPEWRRGTDWFTDREKELALNELSLWRRSPADRPANVVPLG